MLLLSLCSPFPCPVPFILFMFYRLSLVRAPTTSHVAGCHGLLAGISTSCLSLSLLTLATNSTARLILLELCSHKFPQEKVLDSTHDRQNKSWMPWSVLQVFQSLAPTCVSCPIYLSRVHLHPLQPAPAPAYCSQPALILCCTSSHISICPLGHVILSASNICQALIQVLERESSEPNR